MYYKIIKIKLKRYQEINLKRHLFTKARLKRFSFHSRVYEVMVPRPPVPKSPITVRWKQVMQYMTSVTSESVEQIKVHILYNVR